MWAAGRGARVLRGPLWACADLGRLSGLAPPIWPQAGQPANGSLAITLRALVTGSGKRHGTGSAEVAGVGSALLRAYPWETGAAREWGGGRRVLTHSPAFTGGVVLWCTGYAAIRLAANGGK